MGCMNLGSALLTVGKSETDGASEGGCDGLGCLSNGYRTYRAA